MSSAESVDGVSIKQLAAKCRREHFRIRNRILILRKIIEASIAHLSRDELLLVGANIQTLSNLLSDLNSYIAAIQVSEDEVFKPKLTLI